MAAVEVPHTLEYRGGQLNAAPDFQDSPDEEEDTRSSQEYINDLEEEYQARDILAKSKRFFKKGTQRFSSAKATDQTEPQMWKKWSFCKRLLVKDISSFISVTFSTKLLHSSEHKPKPRHTKDFKAKYNKVKAKLALLSSRASAPSSSSGKNKGLIAETKQIPTQKKKILGIDQLTKDTSITGPKDPVFVKSSADNSEVSITGSNKPKLFEVEDFTLSNHDTATDYDSADESSVCSTPLLPLEKLTGVEPVSRPKTIKLILKSKSTFKDETLKGITINEPSSAPARGNKSSSFSKTNSAPA
ncbi:hypothetical protein Tco_1349868, partial [Tanacetum coccineum]